MTRHRLALSAFAGAMLLSAIPAGAQYYDPYRPPPPPYGYDRPPPPPYGYGYDRPRYRQRYNNICVTSRGDCPTPPLPSGTGCSCYIPGFGNKRGAVP
ncbi:hypothetical protein AB4Z10_16060 [Bosea sp. RAF48]|uniref:hypothetical protein n=1 Tax=Bosea sp. RAF48 TaxID=3237480 RepID=UPI003F90511A